MGFTVVAYHSKVWFGCSTATFYKHLTQEFHMFLEVAGSFSYKISLGRIHMFQKNAMSSDEFLNSGVLHTITTSVLEKT